MNWKIRFPHYLLQRGAEYFRQNRVKSLSYENGVYRAKVRGSVMYEVEIWEKNNQLVRMECDCPFATPGRPCKHMAAVLYAIDRDGEKLKQAKLPIVEENVLIPFTTCSKDYQYFDMGRMASEIEVSKKRWNEAQKLIEKKAVVLDRVDLGSGMYLGSKEPFGVARGRLINDDQSSVGLNVIFTRERIQKAHCGTLRCGGYYDTSFYYDRGKLCKHLLALMILLDEYLKKYNPGDATDMYAQELFAGYRSRQMQTMMEQHMDQRKDFLIEPVLEREDDLLYASFKAGTERMYIVKKLTELVESFEQKKIITFGTKTEIDLAKHQLTASSESVYRLIEDVVNEEKNRARSLRIAHGYYADQAEVKNRIVLYGERLDRFFDLFRGNTIAFTDKSGYQTVKKTCALREEKPEIRLAIDVDEDSDGVIHGVKVSGKLPEMIQGNAHRYFFRGDSFCRMSDEFAKQVAPLMQAGRSGDVSFCVGRKRLSEFYHRVLPVLRQYVTIAEKNPEKVRAYIPQEAVYAFYLDVENGAAICKPRAVYAEQEVSLLDCLRENYIFEPFRDQSREEDTMYCLHEIFASADLEKDELYCEDEDAMMALLDGGVERLMALGEVHSTDRFRNANVRRKVTMKVGVSLKSDIMDLSITSEELDQEELLQILSQYRRKKKYYRLKNGTLAEVNETDVELLGQMVDAMHLSAKAFAKGNMKIPLYRALYLNKMLEQGEELYLNRDRNFKNLIKEFKTVDDSEFEIPESLSTVMRNYQIRGFKWLKTLERYGFGGVLADDMGLGKTLQMISVLLSAKEAGKAGGPALVICPASLVYNWKEEFLRFAPALKVVLVAGSQSERAEVISRYNDWDVLVTSYDLLKRDIAEYEEKEFGYQILDEAQYIKNHGTAAAKAVKVIRSRHRYALTGTPIENRLSELWSIFDYLMPGFLYGYETFRKEMETPIVKHKEEEASKRLQKMVAPFILRRLKGDVLKDLPDKMEEIRYARLESEQQKLYDGQVIRMQQMLSGQDDADFQKDKLQILAELTKIRQICCDPGLLFENYRGESAKRLACMELIQSAIAGEHRMLVFSQFTSMLELLEQDLRRQGIEYYKITGATPKESRVELVNSFNQGTTPVFLISLKAGGTGLNLTGADVVIHYDPWWNQAAQNQATDRAHRIGQTKAVSVYKLIVKDTIEEKIVKMQEDKRDLAESILSGETGGLGQMSREELMELLGGGLE